MAGTAIDTAGRGVMAATATSHAVVVAICGTALLPESVASAATDACASSAIERRVVSGATTIAVLLQQRSLRILKTGIHGLLGLFLQPTIVVARAMAGTAIDTAGGGMVAASATSHAIVVAICGTALLPESVASAATDACASRAIERRVVSGATTIAVLLQQRLPDTLEMGFHNLLRLF